MAEEKKQLHIAVRGKIATLTEQNFQLVGGNSDYEVVFDFDEDWKEQNVKTAIFVYGKSAPVYKVFEGNICNGVAIYGATMCLIGVIAGDIMTTTSASVDCVYRSILDDANGTPVPPAEDVYNQIMELLNRYIEGGGGGSDGNVSEEFIISVVKDYLAEHPAQDGFSPTVSITPIVNGHRVTITDIIGDHSFDVMNGEQGEKGEKGDPYTLTNEDRAIIVQDVLNALPNGDEVEY